MTPTREQLEALIAKWREIGRTAPNAWYANGIEGCADDLAACLATPEPCIGHDPRCPCQDGDSCHYRDDPATGTKAWPIPPEPAPEAMPPIEIGDVVITKSSELKSRAVIVRADMPRWLSPATQSRVLAIYRDPVWTREPRR